jgi:hypothetical protein
VELPEDISVAEIILVGAPIFHLGRPVTDNSASGLCVLYLTYLTNLVTEAHRRFAG